ncbi:wax ester/triacylglycerol synthase family O-acyltransferase [Nocardioides mangrovicus]|uniref:Diacylglycerol O-acyltransferase n=1 Tax=Nocardioides mangrovicus TaxID=2478913 RepID=A0A3L8P2T7_9ACTN|nr:wax ester/triacylglycerol synthase family O-acyltransferase [Nocardioides mangrovicus]RLV49163.1 wax ester/triacylglycerol synthase family O-acyltransferase [Nocardioides mangrovicus]
MPTPLDPTAVAFMSAENRSQPMHVGGLAIYRKPEGAGDDYVRSVYEASVNAEEIRPLFLRRPARSVRTAGQWVWERDDQFDIEYHVRHSALPRPGRIRELLELCSRLHGTRLSRERPLWEAHLIEGLYDDTFAMYIKMHHALLDGVSAMRLLQSMLDEDPDRRDMPPPWSQPTSTAGPRTSDGPTSLAELPADVFRSALAMATEAAGMPSALVRTIAKGLRNETSSVSLYAPRTPFNVSITGSRRFAAQGWPLERLRGIADAAGATLNDVVLAMCSGAVRTYLQEMQALPDTTLVAMVPVGLQAKNASVASGEGGNALGAVMVQLGTDLDDPADRLARIHTSMVDGKQALGAMSPAQILAMAGLGMAPAIALPMLRLHEVVRPPFNLIISNVPGPRQPLYLNGARLQGTYPLSIPLQGMALNITCNSYDQDMEFGLTGCRRSVPHLQRLLTYLDTELGLLEKATGVS